MSSKSPPSIRILTATNHDAKEKEKIDPKSLTFDYRPKMQFQDLEEMEMLYPPEEKFDQSNSDISPNNMEDIQNGYDDKPLNIEKVLYPVESEIETPYAQKNPNALIPQKPQERRQSLKIDRVMRSKNEKVEYPAFIIPAKSTTKLVWDTIILIMIVWITIFLPWQIAYPQDTVRALDLTILVFFILDIFITCRTSYLNEENDEVMDPNEILIHYTKSWSFVIDILSAFPISEVYTGQSKTVIRVLYQNNIMEIAQTWKGFQAILE